MKKKSKGSRRALAGLLCLALCLTGCGAPPAPVLDGTGRADSAAQGEAQSGAAFWDELLSHDVSAVRQTLDSKVCAAITHPLAYGMSAGGLWFFGTGKGLDAADDGQNAYQLVCADLDLQTVVCQRLLPPEVSWWQPEKGQTVASEIAVFFAPQTGTALSDALFLLEDCLVDHDADGSAAYSLARFFSTERRYSLCHLAADGTLQHTATLQLPPELQPAEGEKLLFQADGGFRTADGAFGITVIKAQRTADGMGAEPIETYLWRVAPDEGGAGDSCTLLYPGGSLLGGVPLRPTDDCAVYAVSDDERALHEWVTVQGLSTARPTVTRQKMPPEGEDGTPGGWYDTYQPVLQAGDGQPLWWSMNKVCLFDEALQAPTPLLHWNDLGLLQLQQDAVFYLGDGAFLVACTGDGFSLHRVRLGDKAQQQNKRTLTLAVTQDLDASLRTAVESYNFSDPDVLIQPVDYSDAAARAAGFETGLALLQNDILHNTAPDILQLNAALDPPSLAQKGLLVDLYPYLDADRELARTDFVAGALRACEYGTGGLVSLMPCYWLNTAVVGATVLEADATHWTWQQYDDSRAGYAVPLFPYPRDLLLLNYLTNDSGFVDLAAGQAHLDSPAFVALLKESQNWPAAFDDPDASDPKPRIQAKEILAYATTFSHFDKLKLLRYLYDGDFAIPGLPTDGGVGHTFSAVLQLAVTRDCKDPAAAWRFLRTLLLPAFQNEIEGGFPLRADALRAQADAALQPLCNITQLKSFPPYLGAAGLTQAQLAAYWLQGCQAADVARLLVAIQNTDTLPPYDAQLEAILTEELTAFYGGSADAKATAARLQDRVQTYLDERR